MVDAVEDVEETQADESRRRLVPARIQPDEPGVAAQLVRPDEPPGGMNRNAVITDSARRSKRAWIENRD